MPTLVALHRRLLGREASHLRKSWVRLQPAAPAQLHISPCLGRLRGFRPCTPRLCLPAGSPPMPQQAGPASVGCCLPIRMHTCAFTPPPWRRAFRNMQGDNKCRLPQNSCLANQLIDLYAEDKARIRRGEARRGSDVPLQHSSSGCRQRQQYIRAEPDPTLHTRLLSASLAGEAPLYLIGRWGGGPENEEQASYR